MNSLLIKIILFLIFGVILLILMKDMEGFVSGSKTLEYAVNILSKSQGEKVFEKYKDTSNYKDKEIIARSNLKVKNKNDMKRFYIDNVRNFTADEKREIIDAVNYIFRNYGKKMPLIKEWNIIKVSRDVDWGFPFTMDNYIILPEGTIKSSLAKTLFHEQIHIIQRRRKDVFRKYYQDIWGFESYNLPNEKWINKNLVINPDSDDFYKWKLADDLYVLPLPTTDKNRFMESAIFIDNGNILANNEKVHVENLRNVKEYVERFYNAESLYHPGEIFATLLTSMVFDNKSVSMKDQKGIDELFINLKEYF